MASARSVFDYTLTSLLVASALAVATVAVRREFFPRTAPMAAREVAGWKTLANARAPVMGGASAPARVVLFSDFQCPYCRDLEGKLSAALPGMHGRIAIVRYDLPLLRVHAHAYQAAIAARCAARQGMARSFDAALFRRDLDRPASTSRASQRRPACPTSRSSMLACGDRPSRTAWMRTWRWPTASGSRVCPR